MRQRWKKLMEDGGINRICAYIVWFIFGVIIFYLLLLSMLSTSIQAYRQYNDGQGGTYLGGYVFFLPDSLAKNVLVLVGTIAVLFLIYTASQKVKGKGKIHLSVTPLFLSVVVFVAASAFILSTQYSLFSDSAKLMSAAKEFMQGDFHQFDPGPDGYMFRYPYQKGFMLYICLMVKLFGEKSNVAMQIVNGAALAISYYYTGKIAALVWPDKSRGRETWTVLLMALFLPMFFYVTFVYGIIIGLMFSILALYQEFRFFKDEKKWRILLSALFISLSIIMKPQNLIMIITMLILAGVEFFRTKNKWGIGLFGVAVIVLWLMGGQCTDFIMESALGRKMPEGMPHSTCIVMGVEEGVVSPGSFNGRCGELFEENDYDYDATNKAAIEEIMQRFKKFAGDWRYGLDFFGRKSASQWNEPSFQSFTLLRGRNSEKEIPMWMQNLFKGKESILLMEVYNIMQTLILFGTLLYLLFCRKGQTLEQLGFAVIFIGGFIFHIFWEAKGQYAVHYYLLLISYMVQGYGEFILKLYGDWEKIKKKEKIIKRNISIKKAILVICVIMLIVPALHHVSGMKTFRYVFMPETSKELTEEYDKYMEEVKDGRAWY